MLPVIQSITVFIWKKTKHMWRCAPMWAQGQACGHTCRQVRPSWHSLCRQAKNSTVGQACWHLLPWGHRLLHGPWVCLGQWGHRWPHGVQHAAMASQAACGVLVPCGPTWPQRPWAQVCPRPGKLHPWRTACPQGPLLGMCGLAPPWRQVQLYRHMLHVCTWPHMRVLALPCWQLGAHTQACAPMHPHATLHLNSRHCIEHFKCHLVPHTHCHIEQTELYWA